MTDTFKMASLSGGTNPDNWPTVEALISRAKIPADPDWSYKEYATYAEGLDGSRLGQGLPSAVWHWGYLSDSQRKVLRDIIGFSEQVYICTPTNDTDVYGDIVWINALCTALWVTGEEQKGSGVAVGVTIEFRELEEM